MKDLFKNIFIILIIFVLVSGVFSFFSSRNQAAVKNITLNELAGQVNDGKVKTIIVNGQDLEIVLNDSTKEKTTKEAEASLTDSLKNYGVDQIALQKVSLDIKQSGGWQFWLGSVIVPFVLPLILMGVFLWFIMRQAQRGAGQAFGFTKTLARLVMPGDSKKQPTTFRDVAGLKEAKEELEEVVDFLRNPDKFKKVGAKIPKGVLLIGPPGCGKTLLARAVSGEANVPFFHISGSEFVELFVGVGASRVRDTFQTAKRSAPAILFVDELDAIGRQRGAGLGGGHDEREQTLNQILVEMDGFDPETRVIVLAATNRPDILDSALLRPGRFDRRIVLDLPDIGDREEILKIHSQNKPLAAGIDLRQVAERTPGFSGADLANLVNEAAILTARTEKSEISMTELLSSIEKVLLGPERRSHLLSVKEKEIAAYHETGHALVGASLPHIDPVRKVSIISRGQAAGYTLKLPTEDKHLHSKSEFLEELSVLLGGYAAEKLVFNEITTGASSDLEKATDLAHKLVMRYGMSEKLGPRTFGETEDLIFLGKDIATGKDYSDEVAGAIDKEVTDFINNAYNVAVDILTKKRDLLEKITKTLIEKESLEKEEFEELMGKK